MIKYNANPKGWKTGDCVIRAICTATEQSWDKVYEDLTALGFKKKRMPNDKCVYEEYLKKLGWTKHSQPREEDSMSMYKKFTIYELIKKLNMLMFTYKYIIITVANHMTVLKYDGSKYDIVDLWDCGEKTVGNYWVKEE